MIIVVLLLWVWAAGSIVYALYSMAKLQDDPAGRNAALVMGAGGLLFIIGSSRLMLPSVGLMLLGALLSMKLLPTDWLLGQGGGDEPAPAPILGVFLILASLPLLVFASFVLFVNLALLVASLAPSSGYSASPLVFGFGLALFLGGGWLFFAGYRRCGLRDRPAASAVALGAGALAAFGPVLLNAYGFGRQALPAAAPAAPVALVSSDGGLALSMPPGWRAGRREGAVLAASSSTGNLSVSSTGGPFTLDELRQRVAAAQQAAVGKGARLEGEMRAGTLVGERPIAFFRYRMGDSPCYFAELTLKGRSYSIFWQDLTDEDIAAFERSLRQPAPAGPPPAP